MSFLLKYYKCTRCNRKILQTIIFIFFFNFIAIYAYGQNQTDLVNDNHLDTLYNQLLETPVENISIAQNISDEDCFVLARLLQKNNLTNRSGRSAKAAKLFEEFKSRSIQFGADISPLENKKFITELSNIAYLRCLIDLGKVKEAQDGLENIKEVPSTLRDLIFDLELTLIKYYKNFENSQDFFTRIEKLKTKYSTDSEKYSQIKMQEAEFYIKKDENLKAFSILDQLLSSSHKSATLIDVLENYQVLYSKVSSKENQNITLLQPKSALARAEHLFELHALNEAKQECQSVLAGKSLKEQRERALYLSARINQREGEKNYLEALKLYEEILKNSKDPALRAKSAYQLGNCLFYLHDLNSSKKLFADFALNFPKSSLKDDVLSRLARLYEISGEPEKAISTYKNLLEQKIPRNFQTQYYFQLARLSLQIGDPKSAHKYLDKILSLPKNNTYSQEARFLESQCFYAQGDIKAYLESLLDIAEQEPASFYGHLAFEKIQQTIPSLTSLEKEIIQPFLCNRIEAALAKAEFYQNRKDYLEAALAWQRIFLLKQVIEIIPLSIEIIPDQISPIIACSATTIFENLHAYVDYQNICSTFQTMKDTNSFLKLLAEYTKDQGLLYKLANFGLYSDTILLLRENKSFSYNHSYGSNIPLQNYLLANLYKLSGNYYLALSQIEPLAAKFLPEFSLQIFPKPFLEELYPRPYWQIIQNYAEKLKIDPYLILAVAREESRFDEKAVSPALAYGLMQIIPSTASFISKDLLGEDFHLKDIFNVETNIYWGSTYLTYLIQKYKGNLYQTLAAYNAGEAAVQLWSDGTDSTDNSAGNNSLNFLHTISYHETRNYVKKVLFTYQCYVKLYRPDGSTAGNIE